MTKHVLAAAVILGVLLAPAGASAAGSAPDLRATAVRTSAYAHLGGALPVQVTVAVGAGRGRATTVRAYLSRDRTRSRDDLRLPGAASVGAPRRRAHSETTTIDSLVPAKLDGAQRWVIACADDLGRLRETSERNNCRSAPLATAIAATTDPARTTRALIAAGVASGRLSAERALEYRVFDVVGDPRLPARYAGDASADEDHGIFREVADAWPSLSKAARRALRPDLVRPPVQGLARAASGTASAAQDEEDQGTCIRRGADVAWKSVTAAGGKVRINWDPARPEDGAHAGELARDVTTAYARFKQIMGVEPISDAGASCYHGPDGALDIYFDDEIRGADAYTIPAGMMSRVTQQCDGFASYIVARPQSIHFTMRFVLAHELFHAFQNVFPESAGCRDGTWLAEASANWAAHAAFPADDSEHYFTWLMETPEDAPDDRDYHAWPFILWMEKTFGERSIRTTYQLLKSRPSVAAVDQAIGGFRQHYLDFAENAWNQDPMPTFRQWDRYTAAPLIHSFYPMEPVHLLLDGLKQRTAYAPVHLYDRGRQYHPYAITDDRLRELVFRNPLAGDPDFRAGAIITLQSGAVRFDDWSQRKTVRYCRDTPGQDVAALVVVYANSALGGSAGRHLQDASPELGLRDTCEGLPWHFKVLSASLATHAVGSRTASADHLCAALAGLPISGQTTFNAATAGPAPFTLADDVTQQTGGALGGAIGVRAPATFGYDLKGCSGIDGGGPITSCATAFDRSAGGDGLWQIGFSLSAASKDSQTATLSWYLADPSVGFFDADDSACNVQEIWHGLDTGRNQQQIALSELAGTDPVTLTFHGDDSWTTDQLGAPASLAGDWSYAMTVQRVDENGNPLNG